jgi:Flp pilus assembly protein TadG
MQKTTVISQPHQNRRGIAILWLILWGAMFLTFFCVVLEISSMWQAQVELKNTMDAAALAAVREWGLSGGDNTQVARNVGIAYMEGNPVQATTVTVPNDNYNGGNTNQNASLQGSFVFGALETATNPPTSPIYFDPAGSGSCALGDVTITLTKDNSGTSAESSDFLVEFNTNPLTPVDLEIKSISFTLPTAETPPDPDNAFFDGSALVNTDIGPPPTFNGVDPTATNAPTTPFVWNCPNNNGDICFTFSGNNVDGTSGHYGTVTINFNSGSMKQGDFFHFGVGFTGLKPPAYTGQNDGDNWGSYSVPVVVTFLLNGVETDVPTNFVGTSTKGVSIADLSGSGGGYPAVVARASTGAQGFCSQMLGISLFQVSATSVAFYNCTTGRSALVKIDNFPSLTLPPP